MQNDDKACKEKPFESKIRKAFFFVWLGLQISVKCLLAGFDDF